MAAMMFDNHFGFSFGSSSKHFCQIVLNSDHWVCRCLKFLKVVKSKKSATPTGNLVFNFKFVLAIFKEGNMVTISAKMFQTSTNGFREPDV